MKRILLTALIVVALVIPLLLASCTCQMVGDRIEIDCYGDILPCADSTYDVGAVGNEFAEGHFDDLWATGDIDATTYAGVAKSDLELIDDDDYIATLTNRGIWAQVPLTSGWETIKIGTGDLWGSPFALTMRTGINANSVALAQSKTFGFVENDWLARCDWSKPLIFNCSVIRWGNDAQAVSRIQIKKDNLTEWIRKEGNNAKR